MKYNLQEKIENTLEEAQVLNLVGMCFMLSKICPEI